MESVVRAFGIPRARLERSRPTVRRMDDPADLTLVDLLPLLERRQLSARELLDACLARVERHEPQVRAFVVLTPELARAAAERADADRAARRPTGVLAGVPVALKDLYLTAGVPTTASSRVLEGHDPGVDAAVWERLRDAGAGLLGKTTLHEFAYGTGSHPTRNPWDLTRTPGGSSGGSGAALAARTVPVATGSDTGGSLRIPAAACGCPACGRHRGGCRRTARCRCRARSTRPDRWPGGCATSACCCACWPGTTRATPGRSTSRCRPTPTRRART
jgi:hypothetical protein